MSEGDQGPADSAAEGPEGQAGDLFAQELPQGYAREYTSERGNIGLAERLLLLVSKPGELFERLGSNSGWAAPILTVLVAIVFQAAVQMNFTDLEAYHERQRIKAEARMNNFQRRKLKQMSESDRRTSERMGLFGMKMAIVVMPAILTVVSLVFFALVLVALSSICKGRRSFPLALTVAAHALMIDAVRGICTASAAAATGLAMPVTNLSNLAPVEVSPALHVALRWLDPFTAAFFVFLGLGLTRSLKVKHKARAWALLALVFLVGFGLALGGTVAATKAAQMSMKGA